MLPNKIKAALFFFEIQLKSYTKRLGTKIIYKASWQSNQIQDIIFENQRFNTLRTTYYL